MPRLLFVDDEEPFLNAIRRVLRSRSDWELQTCTTAAQAVELLERQPVDVVVSDLNMPEMDGLELLSRVRQAHPGSVRVMLTCSAQHATIPASLVHQLWVKPVAPPTLIRSLERILSAQALLESSELREGAGQVRELPSVPTIIAELLEVASRPDADPGALAEVIARDPAMSAKILQLVNSAFLAPAVKITSVQRAVVYLGAGTVSNLALSEAIHRSFTGHSRVPSFDIDALQEDAMVVGKTAAQLFDDRERYDAAFAAGLLKGVGQLVLADQAPDYFEEALRTARDTLGPLHLVERAAKGATHAEVGAYLLGMWGIPTPVVEGVAHQYGHRPEATAIDVPEAVYIANCLVEECRAEAEGEGAKPILDTQWLATLGVEGQLPAWREIASRALASGVMRVHPRAAVCWEAEWLTAGSAEPRAGEVRDVSRGGLFLRPVPDEAVEPGQQIRIKIHVPDSEVIETGGTVRWSGFSPRHGCQGIGVEFDAVHTELEWKVGAQDPDPDAAEK